MKHLILAATLTLIAAPSFAADSVQPGNMPKAKNFTDTQVGGYSHSYDADSVRAKRDANLRRAAEGRGENMRAVARGLPHYY